MPNTLDNSIHIENAHSVCLIHFLLSWYRHIAQYKSYSTPTQGKLLYNTINMILLAPLAYINYLTCRSEYDSSRQRITLVPVALVQYLALRTRDILPFKFKISTSCRYMYHQVQRIQDINFIGIPFIL